MKHILTTALLIVAISGCKSKPNFDRAKANKEQAKVDREMDSLYKIGQFKGTILIGDPSDSVTSLNIGYQVNIIDNKEITMTDTGYTNEHPITQDMSNVGISEDGYMVVFGNYVNVERIRHPKNSPIHNGIITTHCIAIGHDCLIFTTTEKYCLVITDNATKKDENPQQDYYYHVDFNAKFFDTPKGQIWKGIIKSMPHKTNAQKRKLIKVLEADTTPFTRLHIKK